MMNGVRICETEIMRDPLCLVQQDNLKILLEEEMQENVQYFTLAQIRNQDLKLDGSRFITFDVLENQDLTTVVRFNFRSEEKSSLDRIGRNGKRTFLGIKLQGSGSWNCRQYQ